MYIIEDIIPHNSDFQRKNMEKQVKYDPLDRDRDQRNLVPRESGCSSYDIVSYRCYTYGNPSPDP